jgi:hypothetical protein
VAFGRGRLDQVGQLPHLQKFVFDLRLSTCASRAAAVLCGCPLHEQSQDTKWPHSMVTVHPHELPSGRLSLLTGLRSFFRNFYDPLKLDLGLLHFSSSTAKVAE